MPTDNALVGISACDALSMQKSTMNLWTDNIVAASYFQSCGMLPKGVAHMLKCSTS